MTVVKVKSHIRDGIKVKSYKRNCSAKEITGKYIDIRSNTKIKSPTETGNKFIDKVIIPKIPKIGKIINSINKSYQGGADIARIKASYDETCK